MMRATFLLFTLLFALLFCTACTHPPKPQPITAPAPIAYPATPAGNLLRDYYTTPPGQKSHDNLQELRRLLTENKIDPADRASIEKTMLALIAQDNSPRGLMIAFVLAETNRQIGNAPEIRALVPALIKGLDLPVIKDEGAFIREQWQPIGSVMILTILDPNDYRPYHAILARRLNQPPADPIEPESYEAWTRYILAGMLCNLGKDGTPGLEQAIINPNEITRMSATSAINYFFDKKMESEAREQYQNELPAWYTPARAAEARTQLRAMIPYITKFLSVADLHESAVTALIPLLTADTLPILDKIADSDPDLFIRDSAREAAKKIRAEKLPAPPTTEPKPPTN